jgi:3',5'-cyclic AMP phosphodiesterase CpdA
MAEKRRAAGSEGGAVRFAWFSDPHLNGAPDLAAYQRRFEEATAGARSASPQFTLITGDLVDDADSASYALFRRAAGALPHPVYCLPGNHDVGEKRFAAAPPGSVVTPEKLERYRAEAGPTWYRFEAAGRHFFVLTSSLFGSGLADETAQWRWLEQALTGERGQSCYLAFHHPLYLETPDEPGGTYWNVEPEPRARLLDMLERHSVRAVFTGHVHRGIRHCYRGTHLLTQTAISFGLGKPDERVEGWSVVTLGNHEPKIDFHRLTPGGPVIRDDPESHAAP